MASAQPTAPARLPDPLDRVRGLIRRYVLVEALLTAALVLAVAVLASAAVDLALFHLAGIDLVLDLAWGIRLGVVLLTALLMAASLVYLGLLRFQKDFSDTEIALLLESRFPNELGDRLITAVELADAERAVKQGYSASLLDQIRTEARERLAALPVADVFNWNRLWRRGALLAVLVALPTAAVAVANNVGTARPLDRAAIWGERQLLLRQTPWPRETYLEVVTPEPSEYRIARDAPAPTVRVRALEWVVADRTTPMGWRALTAADLAALGIDAPGLDPDTRLDDLTQVSPRPPGLDGVLGELETLVAADESWRRVRRLSPPEAVGLRYAGLEDATGQLGTTRGELTLVRESAGGYAGELVGLKESVNFTVRARDFRTPPRRVVLVPPPLLTRLTRQERHPAYLYHAPPTDDPAGLAGLMQVQPERDLSITGERTVCGVPAGTDLTLVGTVDKPLARVEVASSRPVPGATVDGDRFTVAFDGTFRLTENIELELTMIDFDGVTSSRAVLVQVAEDRAPTVEVAAEGLRKLASGFICTPKAIVPLVKESLVRDDTGLANAEFRFTATRLESEAAVRLLTQVAAGTVAQQPIAGGVGVQPLFVAMVSRQLGSGGMMQSARLPLPPFERAAAAQFRSTKAVLEKRLAEPLPENWPGLVKDLRFGLEGDRFDLDLADQVLERQGRRMRAESSADVQPRFRVDVAVVATENRPTDPKQSQSLEPIRLTVVSEADLLAEVTKDEEAQTAKFDEVLRRTRDAQAKLAPLADRFATGEVAEEVVTAGRVRAQDIVQDLAQCRDILSNIVAEYERLTREVELNRCDPGVARRFSSAVIMPIRGVLAEEQRRAEDAVSLFRDRLSTTPDSEPGSAARARVAELLARLEEVRRGLGDSLSEAKLRDDLKRMIDRQTEITQALATLKKANVDSLFAPELAAVPPVTLKVNEKATVKVAIDWKLFDKDDLVVRFTPPPGGELVLPAEQKLSFPEAELTFAVEAKAATGTFPVVLTPAVGNPVTVTVIVK